MSKELQFRVSSGLKNIIGKDLITDDFIAIFELVKNSFDAHATKVQTKIYYAGAKGIGRFSCDKLGSYLILTSTKDESNSQTEQIKVDWSRFEQNAKDEFINVNVNYQKLDTYPSKFKTGTMLEISGAE